MINGRELIGQGSVRGKMLSPKNCLLQYLGYHNSVYCVIVYLLSQVLKVIWFIKFSLAF